MLLAPMSLKKIFGGWRLSLYTRVSIGSLVILTLVLFFLPIKEALVIQYLRSGSFITYLDAERGDYLYLAYQHSVNKGEVLDQFLIDQEGKLVLTHSSFESFGAGMSDGLDTGLSLELGEGGLSLEGLHVSLGTLCVAVGSVANHRLRYGPHELALSSVAESLRFVTISYKRIPLIRVLRERIVHGRRTDQ
ncbi:hypothetical protein MASR2M78_32840 [Treponema sp.]